MNLKSRPLRAWLLTRERNERYERRLGNVMILIAALLIVWIIYLGATLPTDPLLHQRWATTRLGLDNFSLPWVGLDCLEMLGLACTGLFLRAGYNVALVTALLAAPLFVVDAWFDVLSAVSQSDFLEAAAMAAFGEIPMACVLGWVAWKVASSPAIELVPEED